MSCGRQAVFLAVSPEEAYAWIGGNKPVGGEYAVPGGWRFK